MLKAHSLIKRHAVPLRGLQDALPFQLSRSALSRLFSLGRWPSRPARAELQPALEAALIQHGFDQADFPAAWDLAEKKPPGGVTPGGPGDQEKPELTLEKQMLHQKTQAHFRLPANPFVDDVQCASDLYLSPEHDYVQEQMWQAARLSSFLAVIGDCGSGKTVMRKSLIDRIQRTNEKMIVVQPRAFFLDKAGKSKLTAQHIADAIIADVSSERPASSLEYKARQIQRLLGESSKAGYRHVVVIEEAHDLTLQTLKSLKRLLELEDGFKRLLGIIMIGQPELDTLLDEGRNYTAREVIRRCQKTRLDPIDAFLGDFLAKKFSRIGVDVNTIIDAAGIDAIRRRLQTTKGSMCYPLTVQNLLTLSMNQCQQLGMRTVTAKLVEGL